MDSATGATALPGTHAATAARLTDDHPATLTIAGLGPGDVGDVTVAVWQALADAPRIILRTAHHPCVPHLPGRDRTTTCDDLYEAHADFGDVYSAIVERALAAAAEPGGVLYAVPGHPQVGEATTFRLLAAAAERGLPVRLLGGLSFIEPAFAAVGVDPMDGGQVVDAMLVARDHHPRVEVGLPLLVAQVYARWLASDLKLTLLNAYPPHHPVTLIHGAGSSSQRTVSVLLHEVDGVDDFGSLTSLYLPPLATGSSFTDLQEIVAHLRAPDGCPWDREQTLDSLRHDLLSETTELLEAIDLEQTGDDNSPHIAEELGDVMLTAAMMAQIASEEGRFQLGDAMLHVVTKLIRRHPHVFGDLQVDGVDNVLANWDAIKAAEKAARGVTPGPLDGIPAALPALEKARELQSKAHKASLLDRAALAAENPALLEALRSAGDPADERTWGRLLWQAVALAKAADVNLEDALRAWVVQWRADHGSVDS
jgi:tetrapyrrole methylase family protein/MazG family protein